LFDLGIQRANKTVRVMVVVGIRVRARVGLDFGLFGSGSSIGLGL
jgi:hypothetical protein